MNHAAQLLAENRRNEAEDHPRNVYADRLEQQGDLARADLIRRPCALAREPAWSRRAAEARWEIEHLLALHGAAWRAELPVLDGVTWLDFERGFVAVARVDDVIVLHTHADAIDAAAPVHTIELAAVTTAVAPSPIDWLRELRFSISWNPVSLTTVRPLLGTVRTLEFPDPQYDPGELLGQVAGALDLEELVISGEHTMGSGVVTELARTPVGNLRKLAIGTEFVDEDTGYFQDPTLRIEGAQALARLRLDRLEVLDVSHQRITNTGFEMVIGAFPKLVDLDVRACELTSFPHLDDFAPVFVRFRASNNPLGDYGVRDLVAADRMVICEALDLATCEIGEGGMRALVRAPCWHTLRSLDLARNPLGAAGAFALARAEPPAQLHRLILENCDLDEGAAYALATCSWLGQLAELDLRKNTISARTLAELASIRVLRLGGATLVNADCDYLAPLWPHLVHADLRGLSCGALLASAPDLQTLRLAGCQLEADAIQRLAAASFPRLRVLDLSDQPISATSLATLLESPLGQIPQLVLANTNLDAAAIDYLARRGAPGVRELDLGRNQLPLDQLRALGRSTALSGVKLHLNGSAWNHPPVVRTELANLLGATWFHYHHSFPEDAEGEDE